MAAELDVQVVAFGPAEQVLACLRSLAGLPVARVVVVDHLGTLGEPLAVEGLAAPVEVVSDPTNPGFGAGQNTALRHGSSPFVLLLNPDARADPDGVAAGVAYLAAHERVAAVQGRIDNDGTGEPERSQGDELGPVHLAGRALALKRWLRLPLVRRAASRLPVVRDTVERVPLEAVEVATLAATAAVFRRRALDEVGGFDESYFMYGEDLDLCRRVRAAGWRLVALPDRFATHVSGGSSAGRWARELQWWQGTMQYAASWWTRPAFAAAMAAAVVAAARLAVADPRRGGPALRALLVRPVRLRLGHEVAAVRG